MSCNTETRRNVMLMAWDFYRADKHEGFSSALRRSWALAKKLAGAAKQIVKRARNGHLALKSTMGARKPMTKAEAYGRAGMGF